MRIKIVFANISGGQSIAGDDAFNEYVRIFREQKADILSLSESHLEDTEQSDMIERLAHELELPNFCSMANSESHLAKGKMLGNSILSKFPITSISRKDIKAPDLETIRPDGTHWKMHDKGVITAEVSIDARRIKIASLHFFPFALFGRSLGDSDFKKQRQDLLQAIAFGTNDRIFITGDFNNVDEKIENAFPEFVTDGFSDAISAQTTMIDRVQKLDHILFQPSKNEMIDSGTFQTPSRHLGIFATFEV